MARCALWARVPCAEQQIAARATWLCARTKKRVCAIAHNATLFYSMLPVFLFLLLCREIDSFLRFEMLFFCRNLLLS